MSGVVKAFVQDTPLDSSEVIVIHRHILFGTPSETAMVDDDILSILDTNGATLNKVACTPLLVRFPCLLG